MSHFSLPVSLTSRFGFGGLLLSRHAAMGRMLLDESVDGKERFRWNSRIASRLKINEKGIAEYNGAIGLTEALESLLRVEQHKGPTRLSSSSQCSHRQVYTCTDFLYSFELILTQR